MGVNYFLVVTAVLVTAVITFLAWYFVRLFKHPTTEEGNSAIWTHILVVFSLTLTGCSVLLPSMDQANGDGDIPMEDIWFALFCTQAVISCVVIPWAIFYYENFNEINVDSKGEISIKSRACDCKAARTATCFTGVAVVVTLILLFMMWAYAGEMEIPVDSYSGHLKDYGTDGVMTQSNECPTGSTDSNGNAVNSYECYPDHTTLNLQTTFAVYVIAFFSFFGWFVLIIFGGIGFFGLPFGLINSWRTRIKGLSPKHREELRLKYGHMAQDVHHIARCMHAKFESPNYSYGKIDKENFAKFKLAYTTLANNVNNYTMMCEVSEQNEGEACKHCMGLLAGILGTIVSLIWVAHIGVYMLPDKPLSTMLNQGLIYLDENVWGFFGVTLYAIFSFYIVLCIIQGNVDFGLNCICFKLHPLQLGETLMASFLFNAMILGITSFSTVQFVSQAFQGYAGSDSSSTVLFHVSARNLKFFTYFFKNNVFIYCLLAVAFLNGLRMMCFRPKKNNLKDMLRDYNMGGKDLTGRAETLGAKQTDDKISIKVDGDMQPLTPKRKK